MKPQLVSLGLGILVLCCDGGNGPDLVTARAQAACVDDSLSLRPSHVGDSRFPIFGEEIGETFYARDTIVAGMTFWRPPTNRSVIGAHLWIVGVDATASPARPDVAQVLLDGPTVTVYDSNPPGQIIEMPFVIDPPLVLPRRGLYAWLLQPENCWQGEAWNIAADDHNPYPDGVYWLSGRVQVACFLRGTDAWEDSTDLLFKIDFCTDATTPALRKSWGAVKTIYR